MSSSPLVILSNASQVVCISNCQERMKVGRSEMNDLAILENASVVMDAVDGLILDVGPAAEIAARYSTAAETIDCSGRSIVPGFVDAHTHPVWAGDRVGEFSMKLAGATYLDIHKAGGGIHFTCRHTTEASEDALLESSRQRLRSMLACGTTTVECKSGYGLASSLETELKMLRVIHRLRQELRQTMDIVCTYLGPHAIPRDMTEEQAVQKILQEHLPALKAAQQQGQIHVDMIDVFHEQGVFGTESSRRMLEEGIKELSVAVNFHGDELHDMGSGLLAAQLSALCMSHCEKTSEDGLRAMAVRQVVAVILPTTAYILRLVPPPVRDMIDAYKVPVALGSDFNPNAYCSSMPLVMNMACVLCRMSMPEALVAATLNAAAAVGRSDVVGSIESGKSADLVVIDSPRWEHLVYEMGESSRRIAMVFKSGRLVVGTAPRAGPL